MDDEKFEQFEENQSSDNNELSEENAAEDGKKKNGVVKELLSWVYTIAGAVIVAFFITHVLVVNANVPSGSMENTIMTGDRIFANRLAYTFSEPERFDIVVFKYPDDESVLFVKRIIGLPGETVEIKDGKIYINGEEEPLRDDFAKEPMMNDPERPYIDKLNFGPYVVPDDSYFMIGDNRNNSKDSREWTNKYVKRDKILGKVFLRYFPNFTYLGNK